MAVDEILVRAVRDLIAGRPGIDERRMFGGLSFLAGGHMFCGVTGAKLLVRTGPDQYEEALAEPHASPMDFTGRVMKGFVFVEPPNGFQGPELRTWIERALRFVETLPERTPVQRAGGRKPRRRSSSH